MAKQQSKKSSGSSSSSSSGNEITKSPLYKEVLATIKRLDKKDPGLKQFLDDAYGYVVFPSVGKAALVIGGAYGRGIVFEEGEPIGFATTGQMTIGVQIGGDTYSEVIAFESEEVMERFKKGRFGFAANAAAVMVKAGAAGTADYEKGATAFVYSEGGMMLELAIGAQKFKFKEGGEEEGGEEGKSGGSEDGQEEGGGGVLGLAGKAVGGAKRALGGVGGALGTAGAGVGRGVGGAATKTTQFVKEHPVKAALIGTGVAGAAVLATRAIRGRGASSNGQKSGGSAGSRPGAGGGAQGKQGGGSGGSGGKSSGSSSGGSKKAAGKK